MRKLGVLIVVGLLAGCAAAPTVTPTPTPPPATSPTATPAPEALVPTGEVSDVLTGLAAPWSMVRLESGRP